MNQPHRTARQVFNACWHMTQDDELRRALDQHCGQDRELRRDVEQLLVAGKQSKDFLEQPPIDLFTWVIEEAPSTDVHDRHKRMDPLGDDPKYRVLEQIGHGGFGEVYRAEQRSPVRRTVAIKVVKPGMDSKEVIARFNAERQALALMSHPGIAKILDAGQTAAGRPYFVMELVEGASVQEYCDAYQLTIKERIELFCDICRAVHHAHQKGIIHRDLKPTNILVHRADETHFPKIIDFGIAKAIGQQLTHETMATAIGVMIGTPMYMSPEQTDVGNEDIDVRSDIYSLGVVLYELLTGITPFDRESLQSSGPEGMKQIIREVDPPLPSRRVLETGSTGLTRHEEVTTKRLSNELRGELDWIVAKAIDKDRSKRYESAHDLALDLQRYLESEPVEAGPPAASYRIKKFAARHKALIATGSLLAIALLSATIVSSVFAYQANVAKHEAERSETETNRALQQVRRSEEIAKQQAAIAKHEAARADTAATTATLAQQREEAARRDAEQAQYVSDIRYVFEKLEHDPTAVVLPALLEHSPRPDEQQPAWEWSYLVSQELQSELSWQASPSNVSNLDWSPNGDMIAATTWSGPSLKVWDSETGKLVREIEGSRMIDYGVDWHPDGRQLAWGSASSDNTVRVWNLDSNEIVELHANSGSHRSVRFSPDGNRLLLATIADVDPPPKYDGTTLAIWKRDGDSWILDKKNRRKHFIRQAEWNHDGALIAVSRWELASIVDPSTAQFVHLFDDVHAMSIGWHPHQNVFACGTRKGELVICDADSKTEVSRFQAHAGHVESVAFSPDGKWLATGGNDREVKIWKAADNTLETRYLGHDGPVNQVAWHPNSQRLASCGKDGRINIWPLHPPPKRVEFQFFPIIPGVDSPSNFHRTPWASETTLMAVVSPTELAEINAATGETISTTEVPADASWYFRSASLACRPDNESAEQPAIECAWINQSKSNRLLLQPAVSVWHNPALRQIAYHQANYGKIILMNLETQSGSTLGEDELILISEVLWSPDNQVIATIGRGRTSDAGNDAHYGYVQLFDARSGTPLRRARVGYNRVHAYAGAWSPDARRIVAGTEDGVCHVFDREGLATKTVAPTHATRVVSMSWHPMNNRVASASQDGTVAIWNPENGKVLLRFKLDAPATFVAWSPDGMRLTASDQRGKIYVWEATRGYDLWRTGAVESVLTDRLTSAFQTAALANDFHRAHEVGFEYLNRNSFADVRQGLVVAMISRLLGREADYQQICEQIRESSLSDLSDGERTAYFQCLALAFGERPLPRATVDAAQHHFEAMKSKPQARWSWALVLLNQNRAQDTLEVLTPLLAKETPPAIAASIAALASAKLDNRREAASRFKQAQRLLKAERFTMQTWDIRLLVELLLQTAEEKTLADD